MGEGLRFIEIGEERELLAGEDVYDGLRMREIAGDKSFHQGAERGLGGVLSDLRELGSGVGCELRRIAGEWCTIV